MSDFAEADLPTAALRSALEFAVLIAADGAKRQPRQAFPAGLKPFLKSPSLPSSALAKVRAAVEGDDEYRRRLGVAAIAELVDEVGRLWLVRPDGWVDAAMALVEAAGKEPDDGSARAERRRREAAEAATVRSRVEVMALQAQLAEAAGRLREVEAERSALDAKVARLTEQLREAQSAGRKAAARGSADEVARLSAQLEAAAAETAEVRAVLDQVLATRAEEGTPADVQRLRELLLEALSLTGDVSGVSKRPRRAGRREPLSIPGGLYGNSDEVAEHLVRSPGVLVLIDGYNVAKLSWPELSLERQREQLVQRCETLARRWGVNVHIVFDGSNDVEGSHARQGRLVRISWSPSGVSADDVVRAEVKALDPAKAVVVVTNDRAIITDVKALGANHVSSESFGALLRR